MFVYVYSRLKGRRKKARENPFQDKMIFKKTSEISNVFASLVIPFNDATNPFRKTWSCDIPPDIT